VWTDDTYRALAQQLQQHNEGRATAVKITVIGRPGTAVEQGQAVVVGLVLMTVDVFGAATFSSHHEINGWDRYVKVNSLG